MGFMQFGQSFDSVKPIDTTFTRSMYLPGPQVVGQEFDIGVIDQRDAILRLAVLGASFRRIASP